jgi:hypothetical protein
MQENKGITMPRIEVEESALEAIKAMAQRLQDERDELLNCLQNLHATVWGECPSLLNEDSGGNSSLDMQIIDIIAKCTAEPNA